MNTLDLSRRQVLALGASGAAALGLGLPSLASASIALKSQAPDFTLRSIDGPNLRLQEQRGKVVLLNFWATWCKPCVGEMPLLAGLARKYHDRGLVVVAASVDDPSEQETVERFASQLPEGMEIWVGATQEDMARLKMGSALPATVLIDREGRVLGARQGAITEGLLDEDIEQALDGKDDEAPRPKKQRPLSGATEAAASLPPPPVL